MCVMTDCGWHHNTCNDTRNAAIARLRNNYADLVYAADPFMADFNTAEHVEYPIYCCTDPDFWSPNILIPANHRICYPEGTVKLFHSMANVENRQHGGKNFKGSPEIIDTVTHLKQKGFPVELVYVTGIPNKDVRYYMAQSDIVIDQLRYGWFGAQAREGLTMGKPVIANLNKEWVENMRVRYNGKYDLPIIHADTGTLSDVIKDLVKHPEKRVEYNKKSRAFANRYLDYRKIARILDMQWIGLLNGEQVAKKYNLAQILAGEK
jgi:glycosyltransferase involved in cell wall biosynthesis